MPTMMSVVTVDGPWPEPRMRRAVEVDRAQLGVGAAEIDQQGGRGIGSRLGALQALLARGEIALEPLDHGLDPRAGRRGAVEAHVEEALLDLGPRRLADDQVAADVEQDVVEARLRRTDRESRGNRARPGRRARRP